MKPITVLIILILIGMFLIVVYWLYEEYKVKNKRQNETYEFLYSLIKYFINIMPVNEESYIFIYRMISAMARLEHKNKVKTIGLTNQFLAKFQSEVKESEKYTPSQIFRVN